MTDTGPGEHAVPYPPDAHPTPGAYPGSGPYPDPGSHPAGGAPPVPGPPQGPGAVPPFPAPPTEGRGGRLWLGLGLGGLALLLCCGGGGAAMFGIATVGSRALNEQVDVVVGDYLDAVQDRRFAEAYDQLCEDAQDAESPGEFAQRVGAEPPITSYDVGDIALTSVEPAVPVQVVYADGGDGTLRVSLRQDTGTGRFEVCGVEG